MKRYERELDAAWKAIEEKTVVTLEDIEELNETFAKVYAKIQMQREELETSRDNWKKKYMELKNEKKM